MTFRVDLRFVIKQAIIELIDSSRAQALFRESHVGRVDSMTVPWYFTIEIGKYCLVTTTSPSM